MASPTRYELTYDFQAYQTANPSDPLPADKLEIEFGNIETTTDEIIDNLDLIQRSDGELANDSVGLDQLKEEVTLTINAATNWATATVYTVNDAVYQNNNVYRCLVAHTSGTFATDLAAGKWELFLNFNQYLSAAESSATDAESSATDAETAQTAAEAAQTAAETAQTNAETAETNAETAQTAAEAAQTAAEAAADLFPDSPTDESFIQYNTGNSEYDVKTPAEVLSAVSLARTFPTAITSGGETVAAADFGKVFEFTTNDQTITLPAFSGVSNGFFVTIVNNTTDKIMTINANGTEKLCTNGGLLSTLYLFAGGSVTLTSTGSVWLVEGDIGLKPYFYVDCVGGTFTNVTGNGTKYTIAYNNEISDKYGMIASGSATLPVKGLWEFSYSYFMSDLTSSATSVFASIDVGGTPYVYDRESGLTASGTENANEISFSKELLTSSAITTAVQVAGMGSDVVDLDANVLNHFTGRFIRQTDIT